MEKLENKKIRVLVTGHTGFKGSWLSLFLYMKGYKVYGISLRNKNKVNLIDSLLKNKIFEESFLININSKLFKKKIKDIRPHIIYHLASQPLVSESYNNPTYTIATNVIGTQNLLEAIKETSSIKNVLFVTSDKVYKNNDTKKKFRENSALGGDDIYSVSKSMQDLLITSYHETFFKKKKISFAILRAGNIIGGGDWSKDRIVVDIMKKIFLKNLLTIRSPQSTRPWLNIFDIVRGYYLAQKFIQNKRGIFVWNFGPNYKSKSVNQILNYYIEKKLLPDNFIKKNKNNLIEKYYLNLNISKASKQLKWRAEIPFTKSLKLAFEWYQIFFDNKKLIYGFSKKQLQENI